MLGLGHPDFGRGPGIAGGIDEGVPLGGLGNVFGPDRGRRDQAAQEVRGGPGHFPPKVQQRRTLTSESIAMMSLFGFRSFRFKEGSGGGFMSTTATNAPGVERTSDVSVEERASPSSTGQKREYDDGFDFPPTAHPGRELFTFSLFVLLIMTAVVWGGWKVISFILPFLKVS